MSSRIVGTLRRIPTWLIFIAAIVGGALILWSQGAMAEIGPTIRGANRWEIALGLLLYATGLILLCLRWHLLVMMVRRESDVVLASEAFLTSVAMNYVAPLSVALPSRALLTMRSLALSKRETAGITFWEVALDLLILVLMTVAWIALSGWRASVSVSVGTIESIVGALLLVMAIVATVVAVRSVRRFRALASTLLGHAGVGLRYPLGRPRQFAVALALSAGFWALQMGIISVLYRAATPSVPSWELVLGLTSLPILVGMLSPVPGGAGVREALMLAVGRVHGASDAAVLMVGVTYRIALFIAIPAVFVLLRLIVALRRTTNEEPVTSTGLEIGSEPRIIHRDRTGHDD